MDVPERVEAYLASQPEPKQTDLRQLHAFILMEFPECRLWLGLDDKTYLARTYGASIGTPA